MPYTSNPHVGKTRRMAVNDVIFGRKTRSEAARHYGVHRSTITKWIKRASEDPKVYINTKSSAPHKQAKELDKEVVDRIIEIRKECGRCAPIIHAMLKEEGIVISLSSVQRTLKRQNLTRKKKQLKPRYGKIDRPRADKPGSLVEVDTIHFQKADGTRFFIYAVIDIYSRIGYAEYRKGISSKTSMKVVRNFTKKFKYQVEVIQTDNGPEFSEALYFELRKIDIKLRHTRIRRPNDNAHVERFIRTIQDECFGGMLPKEKGVNKKLKEFIEYYNNHRLHLGLKCMSPNQFVAKVMN